MKDSVSDQVEIPIRELVKQKSDEFRRMSGAICYDISGDTWKKLSALPPLEEESIDE